MTLIDDQKGKYINQTLKANLDTLKEAIKQKWDGLGLIDGMEGSGKSTLAKQICYYMDRDFSVDNIVFDSDSFTKLVLESKPHTAILFDESYMAFNARAGATRIARALIGMLTMIRKKQLFILIVAPSFFDLSRYIAIHRSRFLINVHSQGMKRGDFSFYNWSKKQMIYHRGKKELRYNVVKHNYIGSFTKFSPVDEEAYEAKKDASFEQFREQTKAPVKLTNTQIRDAQHDLFIWLRDNMLLRPGAILKTGDGFFKTPNRTLSRQLVARKESNLETACAPT